MIKQDQDILLVLPGLRSKETKSGVIDIGNGLEVKVLYIPTVIDPYPTIGGGKYRNELVVKVREYGRMVLEAVKDESFDLIHAHDWLTIPAAILVKEYSGKPIVLHIHSTEYDRTAGGEENNEVAEIEKEGYEKADKIIAVSNYTKSILFGQFGVLDKKVDVVHNGSEKISKIDSNVELLNDRPVIVFVGRLTVHKGPEYFLELAKKVLKERKDAVFVLAGDGDMYKQLMMTAAGMELTGSVLFSGFLNPQTRDIRDCSDFRNWLKLHGEK